MVLHNHVYMYVDDSVERFNSHCTFTRSIIIYVTFAKTVKMGAYYDPTINEYRVITPRAYAQAGLSNRFCLSSLLSLSVIKKI